MALGSIINSFNSSKKRMLSLALDIKNTVKKSTVNQIIINLIVLANIYGMCAILIVTILEIRLNYFNTTRFGFFIF